MLLHEELPVNNVTKSAFSQARHKFKHQAFIELNRDQVEYFYDTFSYKKWKGYRLIAIDGSTCRLPNSENIIDELGIADTSATETPIILARLSQAYDMLNHIVIDAKLANYHTGEHVFAQGYIDCLKSRFLEAGKKISNFQ